MNHPAKWIEEALLSLQEVEIKEREDVEKTNKKKK